MDELQTNILSYQPTSEVRKLFKQTKVLLLVGPTGAGKNTLEQELLKTGLFRPIVTHTTRVPRINRGLLESNGNEYHFISERGAIQMMKEHKFIETAFTHGHLYGTSIQEFKIAKKEGKIPVADIDIKGVRSYRQLSDKVTAIFLLPPSFQILIDRLIARYGKSRNQADIKLRLATALDELSELVNSDYYYSIINNNMALTTKKVLAIVAGKQLPKPSPRAKALALALIDDIKTYLSS
jgi:guanylate kinase